MYQKASTFYYHNNEYRFLQRSNFLEQSPEYLSSSIVERHFEDDGSSVDVVIRFARPRNDVEVIASVNLVRGNTNAFDVEDFANLEKLLSFISDYLTKGNAIKLI